MQRPMGACMRFALGFARGLARGLMALARRRAGIVRRLRRQAELGFELGDTVFQLRIFRNQRIDPFDQRKDQRILRGAIQRLQVGRFNHPSLDSDSRPKRNPLHTTRVNSPQEGEQLPSFG